MERCIDPSVMKEGAIAAYVDGVADAQIREHIAHCPYCAAQAEQHRRITELMRVVLHRATCPTSETLGLYQLRLLPPDEQLVVAKHVRSCPNCQRELMELARDDESPSVPERLRGAMNLIKAQRLPLQHATAFRGRARITQRFRAAGLEIHISIQPGFDRGRRTVMGRLVPLELNAPATGGTEVWLTGRQSYEAWKATVEPQGLFSFEELFPGTYTLGFAWLGQVVAVEVEVN